MNFFFRRLFTSGAQVARSSTDSIVHNVKENKSTYGIILAIGFGCYSVMERSQNKFQAKLEGSFKEHRKEVLDALKDFRELLQPTLVDVQVNKQYIADLTSIRIDVEVNKRDIAGLNSLAHQRDSSNDKPGSSS